MQMIVGASHTIVLSIKINQSILALSWQKESLYLPIHGTNHAMVSGIWLAEYGIPKLYGEFTLPYFILIIIDCQYHCDLARWRNCQVVDS